MGKTIVVTDRREHVFTVKGIVETPPSNSSVKFDFILSRGYKGFSLSGADFILVNNNFNPDKFSEKIKNVYTVNGARHGAPTHRNQFQTRRKK